MVQIPNNQGAWCFANTPMSSPPDTAWNQRDSYQVWTKTPTESAQHFRNPQDRAPGCLDSRQQIILSTFHEFWIEGSSEYQPCPFHETMSQRMHYQSCLNDCLSGTMVFGSYPSESKPMFTQLSQEICYDFSVKRVFDKSLGASYPKAKRVSSSPSWIDWFSKKFL